MLNSWNSCFFFRGMCEICDDLTRCYHTSSSFSSAPPIHCPRPEEEENEERSGGEGRGEGDTLTNTALTSFLHLQIIKQSRSYESHARTAHAIRPCQQKQRVLYLISILLLIWIHGMEGLLSIDIGKEYLLKVSTTKWCKN